MDHPLTRRAFLASSAGGAAALSLGGLGVGQAHGAVGLRTEARYYDKKADKVVECRLCPRKCRVADRERGFCGVRENIDGVYYTLVHSNPCSLHNDPIEKKPLFHFLPGTTVLSLATAGCNIQCRFCQNWEISQFRPEQVRTIQLSPAAVVGLAQRHGSPSIAFTYAEPVVFYEYMADTAKKAREQGVRVVAISNGYILEEPLRALCPLLSAIKIDLKAFTEKFYKEVCRGELKPVLRSLEIIRASGIWLEIVVLVIPTLNDEEAEIRSMARWIKENLGPQVPLHFTRFHPTYMLKNLPSTPVQTLERARSVALDEGLHFVYAGNVPGHPGENTVCPGCKEVLIQRVGFQLAVNRAATGVCPKCQRVIPGVF